MRKALTRLAWAHSIRSQNANPIFAKVLLETLRRSALVWMGWAYKKFCATFAFLWACVRFRMEFHHSPQCAAWFWASHARKTKFPSLSGNLLSTNWQTCVRILSFSPSTDGASKKAIFLIHVSMFLFTNNKKFICVFTNSTAEFKIVWLSSFSPFYSQLDNL